MFEISDFITFQKYYLGKENMSVIKKKYGKLMSFGILDWIIAFVCLTFGQRL